MRYHVWWPYEIEANSPMEAAQRVLEVIQQHIHDPTYNHFCVLTDAELRHELGKNYIRYNDSKYLYNPTRFQTPNTINPGADTQLVIFGSGDEP